MFSFFRKSDVALKPNAETYAEVSINTLVLPAKVLIVLELSPGEVVDPNK
jgi:hypothetical protein